MHCASSSKLITALQNPTLYDHAVTGFEVVETHISWVILTGMVAYKIKKPVNLGFLDFSTLALRQHFCEEELRLNRRTAHEFYLDVLAITGSPDAPQWNGAGEIIEYAVKMRQFPREMELDRIAQSALLTETHINKLALDLAALHQTAARAEPQSSYGSDETVWQPIKENFQLLQSHCTDSTVTPLLEQLWTWCVANHGQHVARFHARKQQGFIRECHGDLHLANMFLWQDRIVVFDCLEFNPVLRWIDVISDLAFLTMDLRDRGLVTYARVILNDYLQATGDYAGLSLLDCYQVYRAMVRAKVACIRQQQADLSNHERQALQQQVMEYLQLAWQFTLVRRPILFITYGVSGSGKTYATQALIRQFDIVRVRSDVERKRMAGIAANQLSHSSVNQGIYTADWTAQTYAALGTAARAILTSGYHAIVDATFLKYAQRQQFHALAKTLNIPLVILAFQASPATLQQRIQARLATQQDASEADLAVLERQCQHIEPLTMAEMTYAISIDSELPNVQHQLVAKVTQFIQQHETQGVAPN